MFLYTPEALEYLGDISVAQMVSFLMDGLVTANEALVNSKINAEFALVYMGMVRRFQKDALGLISRSQAARVTLSGCWEGSTFSSAFVVIGQITTTLLLAV